METHRVETTVQQNGRIVIDDLPFAEGEKVEVVVTESKYGNNENIDPYSLRGTVYRYDDPFEPACPPEDWEALK